MNPPTHPKREHVYLNQDLVDQCAKDADFELVMLPSEHVPDNHRICVGCNQILPLKKFGGGLSVSSYCKECTRRLFYRTKTWRGNLG